MHITMQQEAATQTVHNQYNKLINYHNTTTSHHIIKNQQSGLWL